MQTFELGNEYIFIGKSITKGTQIKYKKDDLFLKLDGSGREAFVEYVVSNILNCSDLEKKDYVVYDMCQVNHKSACYSYNFLKDDEEFITMNSLYQIATGGVDLSDHLASLSGAKERLEYLCNLASAFGISEKDFRTYLHNLVQLDLLIENTDRHVHNYGIILNNTTGNYRIAPIFDNARALHTVEETYCSCTLSGSFHDQLTAFEFPVKSSFRLDYKRVYAFLDDTLKAYGDYKEIQFLRNQLQQYQDLFCK